MKDVKNNLLTHYALLKMLLTNEKQCFVFLSLSYTFTNDEKRGSDDGGLLMTV
jgi:hypothetical protein